ncbi:unnamed protein product, partial [Prunus brigantina]
RRVLTKQLFWDEFVDRSVQPIRADLKDAESVRERIEGNLKTS